jgi:hypothetical protein
VTHSLSNTATHDNSNHDVTSKVNQELEDSKLDAVTGGFAGYAYTTIGWGFGGGSTPARGPAPGGGGFFSPGF